MLINAVAPFAGAWIEINVLGGCKSLREVAPFAGAWIEIDVAFSGECSELVAPFAGAWIEIRSSRWRKHENQSLPSRERGLKLYERAKLILSICRSLRGCVD